MLDVEKKSPLKLLIVEDNAADRRLFQEGVKHGTFDVTLHFATNGIEALRFLREQASGAKPDGILLDLNLPMMDGREFLAEVRRAPDLAAIPIVVLSSSRHSEDLSAAFANGASHYLEKPTDLKEYFEVVQGALNYVAHRAAS